MITAGYICSFLYAFICIFTAFLLKKAGLATKITRKVVHIAIGFEWAVLYHFFGGGVHFLVVCLACSLLLLLEYKLHLVPAISSDGDNAPGTVYYGIAMSAMALISLFVPEMMIPFGVGVFATSVGDGFAGLAGELIKCKNPKIYGKKTLFGTLTMLVLTFLCVLLFKYIFDLEIRIWQMILISLFAASVELISVMGLDNITVTLGTAFLTYAFIYIPGVTSYILPIVLTPIIIAFARGKGVLSRCGVLCAVILDILVSLAFGNAGFLILLIFLLLSVVTDKIKSSGKLSRGIVTESSDLSRGARQVIANGAVGAVCALLFLITGLPVFTVMYIASVAEAFADTVASGIGALSNTTFDLFRFRRCESGISGGMSPLGTASSLVASHVISALALAFGMVDLISAVIITFSAFAGMIFDSLLGSLVQVKYRCRGCGRITEQREHCGTLTEKHSGLSIVNNDVVNILSNIFAVLLVLFLVL